MGRGLGPTQRAILDLLSADRNHWHHVADMAEALNRDPRQVRAAVDALERRGLLEVERNQVLDYREWGQRWTWRRPWPEDFENGDVVETRRVEHGEPYPDGFDVGGDTTNYWAAHDIHLVRRWLPVVGSRVCWPRDPPQERARGRTMPTRPPAGRDDGTSASPQRR